LEDHLDRVTIDPLTIPGDVLCSPNAVMAIDLIQNREFHCSVCPYGRFHSVITGMKRDLRRSLCLDGEPTAEVDVSCCQPLLLAHLACLDASGRFPASEQARLGSAEAKPKKAASANNTHPTPTTRHSPLDHPTILWDLGSKIAYEKPGDACGIGADLREFLGLCQGGKVYEAIAELWGLPREMTPEQRGQFKGQVFRTLAFGRIPREGFDNYEQWLAVARRFPSLADYLCRMKLGTGDHGVVARLAQRVESWLMLDRICGRIVDEHPDAGLVTVHDSVLTQTPRVKAVEAIMRDEFRALGMRASVRVK
jgi:hypothetical protein